LCGIAGFTHLRDVPSRERIVRSVESLSHRGPDQRSVYETHFISMGATRLKIIDLDGGDQPIFTEDGDIAIVFNGEVYNHAELRVELEARGHRFRSRTDTEVVLAAFVEWDIECFSRLRGMFAIALWTESKKRLVLARDRVGIKPLYIARRGQDLYFGSELKTILVHPEIERKLNMAALDCYLSMNYVPGPWSMVEGIEKLEQGHWLEWREGRVRSEAYWRLPKIPSRDRKEAVELEAQDELDRLLRESVAEHLGSDVDLGVWLSGGVDSSAIVHYAAQSRTRLKTFSVSFRGHSFDESGYIRQVTDRYGTDHQELDLNPNEDLAGAIEDFAHFADEPNADAGALPVWFLAKMTRKTATVALSGEGADELFGGYLTYRADALARTARHVPRALLRAGRYAMTYWPVSDEKISFEYKVKRFLDGCLMPPGEAHVYWNGTFSAAQKRELLRTAPNGAFSSLTAGTPDNLAGFLRFDQKYYLVDDILSKVDRMSMAHSVEVRPPFLDHRIVEFAATLPDDLKIKGDRQKVILKDLMKNKLPPAVLSRKKVGFDIPAHEWLRGPLRPLLQDMVSMAGSEYGDLFERKFIEKCVREHLDRRANLGYHLWGLTILFLWMKKWRIQTTGEPALQQMASAAFTSI
jgi:asparagine synthase (glutamine-hydrolysing)